MHFTIDAINACLLYPCCAFNLFNNVIVLHMTVLLSFNAHDMWACTDHFLVNKICTTTLTQFRTNQSKAVFENGFEWGINVIQCSGNLVTGATLWRHQMALLVLCEGNPPVTSEFPSQGPVTRSFDIFLICVWTNGWANNRDAPYLRRHRAHYDVTVMILGFLHQAEHVESGNDK